MRRVGRWMALGVAVAAVAWVALFLVFAPDLPDTTELWRVRKSPGVTIVTADGAVIAQHGAFNGAMIGVAALPPYLPQAVIATEDRRFYTHFGMDVLGFTRALVANVRAGGIVQGGSTITQQLAKNLYLSPERTLARKIRELILAIWLEARLSKDEILTLYLNRVYLGAGTYGVEAAARRYFGKSARRLTLAEAAMIAGLLKAPARYAPTNDLARSQARAAQVLANMVDADYLSAARAEAARRAPAVPVTLDGTRQSRYFVDWVLARLPALAGSTNDDLIVTTTLDTAVQKAAENAVARALEKSGKRLAVGQGALVALDATGAVRAMVGGRSYGESQFNRAVQAVRQPGSAFKPFVFLAALESGLTPDTMITDEPVTVDGWRPRNFSGAYQGPVTLKRALARSINTVAVQLSERVGRERVIATAHRLGLTSRVGPHASLALGTSEVTLLELTAAYVPFANGGAAVLPHGIVTVRVRDGPILYRRHGGMAGRVADPRHVGQMNAMLSEAMKSGTGRAARLKGRPAAGKTGTSQDYRDAWFIGYTADLVAGVWLGNDDDAPMKKVTGGTLPARLWKDFMAHAPMATAGRALPSGAVAAGGEGPSWSVGIEVNIGNLIDDIAKWFSGTGGGGGGGSGDTDTDAPDH